MLPLPKDHIDARVDNSVDLVRLVWKRSIEVQQRCSDIDKKKKNGQWVEGGAYVEDQLANEKKIT